MGRRSSTPKPPPLVVVEWLDAATTGEWTHAADPSLHEPVPCRTAGFLIRRTRKSLTVASTIGATLGDGEVNAVTVIPRPWVIKIVEVGDG
jgi:hypothetical protein